MATATQTPEGVTVITRAEVQRSRRGREFKANPQITNALKAVQGDSGVRFDKPFGKVDNDQAARQKVRSQITAHWNAMHKATKENPAPKLTIEFSPDGVAQVVLSKRSS